MVRDRLRMARGKRSQQVVSSAIGISQKYLSKLELGVRVPSVRVMYSLCCYYELDVKVLFPDIFLEINTP